MSHFTAIRTKIADAKFLLLALQDLGFADVEVHREARHLDGYRGDTRPEMAEIIVRRQHLGRISNDIGFQQQPDGSFTAIISEFDRGAKYGEPWLGRLTQRYAYHATKAHLEAQGFAVQEQSVEGGRVHLLLRRAQW